LGYNLRIILTIYSFGLVLCMVTVPIPQQKSMPNNTKSEGEYVSAIHDLNLHTKDLKDSIGRWTSANTIFVGVTFIAAFGLFVTQRASNSKGNQLVRAEEDLGNAKDNLASLRIEAIRGTNIQLQATLDKNSGNVATLQKDASDAKSAQLNTEIELEKQREKTALAETKLLELAKKQAPRSIAKGALSSLLIGKPAGLVRIEYEPDDTEAYQFAMDIFTEFTGTGWKINRVEKIPDNASLASSLPPEGRKYMTEQELAAERQLFPISVRRGGGAGLAILANSIQIDSSTNKAFIALRAGLLAVNSQIATRVDSTLPDNSFIIVVGPKP
jgi:hypothetical protein